MGLAHISLSVVYKFHGESERFAQHLKDYIEGTLDDGPYGSDATVHMVETYDAAEWSNI